MREEDIKIGMPVWFDVTILKYRYSEWSNPIVYNMDHRWRGYKVININNHNGEKHLGVTDESTVSKGNYYMIPFSELYEKGLLETDLKQQSIMDKQQFTVGGSQALLEAFIKDSGYPACNESTIKYPYIGPETVAGEQALYGTFDPDDLNYTLPEQYTEALEAVKNYFKKKEDGFKEGDYVTCIDDSTDFDLAYGRAEWRERAKIRKGDVLQVEKVRDNEIMFDGIWQTKQAFRPSTKEEIARKDSIYVAGYEMQIIEDKTGRKKAKFCDQFFTLEMLQAYRHLAWMSKYTSVSINVGGTELSWDLLNKITIKLA